MEEDVNYWLRQFGGESALTELLTRESTRARKPPSRPTKPLEIEAGPIDNPFPPGYGEDLLENEER